MSELEVIDVQPHCPDCPETDLGMSNFDHEIEPGFEEALRAGGVFGRHAGWNFNGCVWFAGGRFHEEVFQYHQSQGVRSAETLQDLMRVVNDEFGWD